MSFFKKNFNKIIMISIFIIIGLIEYAKYSYFKVEFNTLTFFSKYILFILLTIISDFSFKENKFFRNYINTILLVFGGLSIIFNSFNSLGLLLLFMFIFMISLVIKIKTKFNYEISIVISVSLLILLFVIIGLLNLLKLSLLFLLIIAISSFIYLYKYRKKINIELKVPDKKALIIFAILFLIAILSGVGRYVHKWDEYSYWAYAAKVLINTDSFKMMVSSVSSMYNYPPVSSIWHYIISIFTGYSEPNLYIGLSILTFVYLMPLFMHCSKKDLLFNILIIIAAVCSPLLFDGSINYGLLYVDLLLGVMCASIFIIKDYIEDKKLSKFPIYLLLILVTLLKPNGFVFSCSLLLLFWLKDLMILNKYNIKTLYNSVKKYLLLVVICLGIYVSWFIFSKIISDSNFGYMFNLMPDILKSDIMPKLNLEFLLNFFNGIINTFDGSILYSFVNIPLFVFLGAIFTIIVYLDDNKKTNNIQKILPYIIFYIVFLLLTAASLFIMFSYFEASNLASFTRYLAPINIGLLLFVIYKFSINDKKLNYAYVFYIIVILLTGFSNITFFITDVSERMETSYIKDQRNKIFSIVNENTEESAKVYVLNQSDEDNIMPLWYARFYCYPRIVNASSTAITWKVKTESNEWDLQDWGLNKNTFAEHLLDYDFDYLFLYSKTDELFDELRLYFDNYELAKEYSLFKIEKKLGKMRLIPIK